MLDKRHFPKLVFGGIVGIAIGIALFGFLTFTNSLDAMQRARQENIAWSASQLERELARFQDALGSSRAGSSNSSTDINQRFDVLWSRVAIFQRGKVGERLRTYDTDNVIGRLFEELKRQETAVVSITSFDFTTLARVSNAFYPFGNELHELSRRVVVGEEEKAAQIRGELSQGANFALYASMLTVAMVIAALFYFVYEAKQFRRLAHKNKILANQFKEASEVKSRFLTMMSHELRTPMNGVLGLLALARAVEQNDEQLKRLDQVDRSANRMLDMLTDILDFAALENEHLELVEKPFFSNELLLALPELLGPMAEQAKVRLEVSAADDLPVLLCGDAVRLQRSYALMVTYFLETAGARHIKLFLSHEKGHLTASITVDYTGGGWSPDLIFGNRTESSESFAAEALGPSVARVLIEKMEGEIALSTTEDDKILLTLKVPLAPLEPRKLKVHMQTQSAPMEMICKSSLSGISIDYLGAEAVDMAEIIIVESGASDEAEKLKAMRADSPKALLFGIGRPQNPALYDFVADVPQEAAQLRAQLSEALA